VPEAKPEAVAAVPPNGDHEYVYPPAPPDALTVALPFEPPKQETLVWDDAVTDKAVGCVTVKLLVAVQLFASVTVTV
jgi:hypothetical protein